MDRMFSIGKRDSDVLLPPAINLFFLSNFSPNIAPYSIFPIEPELRFGLLSGEFMILSTINVSGFARWLEKRGYIVQLLSLEGIDGAQSEIDIPIMRVTQGRASVIIGLNTFNIAAAEFWMPESIEETIYTVLQDAPRHRETDSLAQVIYPNEGKYAWD